MRTEDILARQAEVRAIREALGTYLVVFDFETKAAVKERSEPQVSGLWVTADTEEALTKESRKGTCQA